MLLDGEQSEMIFIDHPSSEMSVGINQFITAKTFLCQNISCIEKEPRELLFTQLTEIKCRGNYLFSAIYKRTWDYRERAKLASYSTSEQIGLEPKNTLNTSYSKNEITFFRTHLS